MIRLQQQGKNSAYGARAKDLTKDLERTRHCSKNVRRGSRQNDDQNSPKVTKQNIKQSSEKLARGDQIFFTEREIKSHEFHSQTCINSATPLSLKSGATANM